MRNFDLNIEKVLENWSNADAIREIIANALDEKILTKTRDIEIFKDNFAKWHIFDFGRGIQSMHFTQNENPEKQNSKNLIGKFGVGLKDALGVLFNNGVNVTINSKYGYITLMMIQKTGFNIKTLHAVFDTPIDCGKVGTEFILSGVDDQDIEKAKQMFLAFNNETLLEITHYGQIYSRIPDHPAYIYINGVRAAEEENFLFSYNITDLNAKIKKALNRERSNVGRSAYAEMVKKILLSSKSEVVLKHLVEDLDNLMKWIAKDESNWLDVTSYAVKILNEKDGFVFMTPEERSHLTNYEVEILNQNGKQLILIPDTVINKVGETITTFNDVFENYQKSFVYSFVDISELSKKEQDVYNLVDKVKQLFKEKEYRVDVPILISKRIRIDSFGEETCGVYDSLENRIIIKRSALCNSAKFCSVLAHELFHYQHGYDDNTRDFENDLTAVLGDMVCSILERLSYKNWNILRYFYS